MMQNKDLENKVDSFSLGSIGVVVVVYHPDVSLLATKLRRLGTELSIAVVDNTPVKEISIALSNVTYIPLHENTGIANAQNQGIGSLMERGCSHIVFFDQDSDFTEDFVRSMVSEYIRISAIRPNLFLLGPRVLNKTSGEQYRSVVHTEAAADCGFVLKREIISSGSCVSVDRLREVGMMDARLFIDYVDFEHCWRAVDKGFVCGVTDNVVLPHKVGSRELRFPRGYRVIISAPFRYYYQYRNWLWLCRRSYVPRQWKLNTGVKFIARILYFPFAVKGWWTIETNMFKGIYHGIFNRKL